MRQINTLSLGTAPGSPAILQRDVNFPEGQQATILELEIACPVKNTSGGNVTLNQDDLTDIFKTLVGNFTLKFGRQSPEIVDNAVTFDDARLLFKHLTGRDYLVEGLPLSEYDALDADGITIAAGATTTITFVFARAFVFERLGEDRNRWCPGTTQMRQMILEINRGAATLAAATGKALDQPSEASITIITQHVREEAEDQWSPIIRMFRKHETGQICAGPAEGGAILGVFEANAAGAATALKLFTLGRKGDEPIHQAVTASRVVRQGRYDVPVGAIDLNDEVTVLYQPPERVRPEELPIGEGFFLEQHSQDINTLKVLWVYVPEMSALRADSVVGPNAADLLGEVKLSTLTADNASPELAAILPVSILRRNRGNDFHTRPGLVFQRGSQIRQVDVPAAAQAAAAATVKAQPTAEAQQEVAAKAALQIGKFLPGGTAAKRGGVAPRTMDLLKNIVAVAGVPELEGGALLTLRK